MCLSNYFQAPHAVHMRSGIRFGDTPLVDTMQLDGLTDAMNKYPMGITGIVYNSL